LLGGKKVHPRRQNPGYAYARRLVLLQFYGIVRSAAIKQKRELVLFYFYFSFIAVVRAA